MDPLTLGLISTTLGVTSGVAILALGAFSFLGGRSRPRGALAFAFFGVLLGVTFVLTNLTRQVGSAQVSLALNTAAIAVALPLPYLLYEFALAQAPRPGAFFRLLRWGLAGLCAATAVLFAVAPSFFLKGVLPLEGVFFPDRGPLYAVLVTLPFFAALGFALVQLRAGARGSPTPRLTLRIGTLLAGLGIYLSFSAGRNLLFYLTGLLYFPSDATDAIFIATFLGLAALCARLGFDALATAWHAPTHAERRISYLVASALLVPLLFGAIEGALVVVFNISAFNTIGLWRLVGVAIIAYGLAQWRFYDLPQRAVAAAATTGGAALAVAGGALAYGVGSLAASATVAPIAALLVTAAVIAPSIRAVGHLVRSRVGLAPGQATKALYGRRIDSYRAAVEASLVHGTLVEDENFLAALRDRFAISDVEDQVLRHYAECSVIMPRTPQVWGAYERLRILDEENGGRTWLARDRSRDRLVVMKATLERVAQDSRTREAGLREARVAAKVRHPNVVAIEDVLDGKASPIVVMEFVEGGSLRDLIRARGSLPASESVALVCRILAGAEAIHWAGIVHGDIKPSNVLLTADGAPKITDFFERATHTIADTFAYTAPEIRAGLTTGDRRSDVYSCAVLLHECLHGAPPDIASPAIIRREVPASITAALARGLAERPEARFPTARAFSEELARAISP